MALTSQIWRAASVVRRAASVCWAAILQVASCRTSVTSRCDLTTCCNDSAWTCTQKRVKENSCHITQFVNLYIYFMEQMHYEKKKNHWTTTRSSCLKIWSLKFGVLKSLLEFTFTPLLMHWCVCRQVTTNVPLIKLGLNPDYLISQSCYKNQMTWN